MSDKLTIADVARRANVSPSTVSRVLNGVEGVTPAMRQAVQAVIDELNYRPNLNAQSLARGHSLLIGIVTQDIASPFYGEICKGIEEGLQGHGYSSLFVSGHWQAEQENAALHTLLQLRVNGLIVLGGQSQDTFLRQLAQQLPLVAVGRSILGLEAHCLRVDNMQGAYTATRHLLDLGHRRIAYIQGIASHQDSIDRYQGYCQALAEAGLEIDPTLVVEGDFSEHGGRMAVETLLAQGGLFTAILAANDQTAYGVRLGLFNHHLQVPEDISLVGFDNQPISQYMIPPLTTVAQPTLDLGKVAAVAVVDLIAGKSLNLAPLRTSFIVRRSTARRR